MQSRLVSIIIPAYNASAFIEEALASVFEQTYPSLEVIVVDDGSTDDTVKVLERFDGRIRLERQENQGPAAARNRGLRLANGEFLAFLDADDLWTRDKLEKQVGFMEENPGIGLLFADFEEFDEQGVMVSSFLAEKTLFKKLGAPKVIPEPFLQLLQENFVPTSTVLLRSKCLEKVGLFDEGIWSLEDRDLWLRVAANYQLGCQPEVLCRKRFHGENISRAGERVFRNRLKAFEKAYGSFPELASEATWHKVIGRASSDLAYSLAEALRLRECRKYALKSLRHRRIFAVEAIFLSFAGPRFFKYYWRRRGATARFFRKLVGRGNDSIEQQQRT